MRIEGTLPQIAITISDKKLEQILTLVESVPLPESDESLEPLEKIDRRRSSQLMIVNIIQKS